MKINKLIYGVAIIATIGAMLSSCSNEIDAPSIDKTNAGVLAKAPKVIAYSGDKFWNANGAISTKASSGTAAWESSRNSTLDRAHEQEIIDEWLPEKNGNLKEGLETDFIFYAERDVTFEIYPVFSQTTTPNSLGLFYYDNDGVYHEETVWNNMQPWDLTETKYDEPVLDSWVDDPNHWSGEGGYYSQWGVTYSKGVKISIPAGYKFGFFWSGNTDTGAATTYYTSFEKNEEIYCTDGGGNRLDPETTSQFHAVTFVLDGKTYIGFEDWSDFDFQDWVFTCDQKLTIVPSSDPVIPDDDDNGDDTTPGIPGDDHTSEVETNLHITDKDGKYPESHLSIHVRTAADIDMFIPMPLDMVCPADDLEIVKRHFEGETIHGGTFENAEKDEDGKITMQGGLLSKVDYQIGEWTVSLYVEYVVAGYTSIDGDTFSEDGIHIWTEGLEGNTALMEYLQNEYGDGITFEIWNYYNEDADLFVLKQYLDRAIIKFIGQLPDYYINAFGQDIFTDGEDCNVSIVDDQKNDYEHMGESEHLNGSDKNQIFKYKETKEE